MTSAELLSTFGEARLKECFHARVRRPWWRRWFRTFEDIPESPIEIGVVRIGKFKKIFRALTAEARFRSAAWQWLKPDRPCLSLRQLGGLRQVAGLEHVARETFVKELLNYCEEVERKAPPLGLWVKRRMALLEFELQQQEELPAELREAQILLRRALVESINLLWQAPPEKVILVAEELSSNAMEAAARATLHVLGRKKACKLSANLMVPVAPCEAGGPAYGPTEAIRRKAEKAAALWSNCPTDAKCLVVVAETTEAQHLGFWVPVMRGDRGAVLPGAPAAYLEMGGSAVFKEDLPPLEGFPAALTAKWGAYMEGDFQERMFVSLPFDVPKISSPRGTRAVVAVLNVNADPVPEDGWRRAYHEEWLTRARDYAAPFVEIAYYALLLKQRAVVDHPKERIALDTGAQGWNVLPGV